MEKSNRNNIFFLSTGRTSTTFLYNLFNKVYPELNITHQEKFSRLINIINNLPTGYKVKNKLNILIYRYLKNKKFPSNTVDPLQSMAIANLLKENVSNNKIVHVVRDPRTFVVSFMKWRKDSIKKIILHYLIPFWMPIPYNHLHIKKIISLPKKYQFCWVWFLKNKLFWEKFHRSKNYLLIKMEDLLHEDKKQETYQKISEFLNLENRNIDFKTISFEKLNKSRKTYPNYSEWNEKDRIYLRNVCGTLMKRFGYY